MLIPLYLQFGKYKPDWGDVPTWAAAVLALIAGFIAWRAFVVSKRAYKVARDIYEVESKRDQQTAEERRAREAAERQVQASKVATWFGDNPKRDDPTEPDRFLPGALVRNASDLPVYDAYVTFAWVASGAPTVTIADERPSRGDLPVVPPGETVFVMIPPETKAMLGEIRPEWYLVAIEFRDANGVRWKRDPYGKLSEVEAE